MTPPTNKVPVQSKAPSLPSSERRRDTRFPFSASGEVIEIMSGVRVAGRTSDLSLGGCYVDSICPCPVGAVVKVRIKKGHETLEAIGRVVYSQVGMGMGVMFDSAPSNQVLEKWILELSGKIPTEPEGPAELFQPREVSPGSVNDDQFLVLNELIIVLRRKKVLSAVEGKSLLTTLHRERPLLSKNSLDL